MAKHGGTQNGYSELLRADGLYPIVLRFKSIYPKDVKSMIAHAKRTIGDHSHCDPSRQPLNRILVGSDEIADEVMELEKVLKGLNHISLIEGTKKSRGHDAFLKAVEKGAKNPWHENQKSGGPLREVLMSLHRDYFRAGDDCPPDRMLKFLDDDGCVAQFDTNICDKFVEEAIGFLQENFQDMLQYCRVDMDEQAIHLQGLIFDIEELPPSARYAKGRSLFRCSHHKLLSGTKDKQTGKTGYELAQDAVGDWFQQPCRLDMDIVRGEKRAEAKREAYELGKQAIEYVEAMDLSDLVFYQDRQPRKSPIPSGSKAAQMIYAIKERASLSAEQGKMRLDERQKLAIQLLEAGGIVRHEEQEKARTRKLRKALLQQHEGAFGTVDEIVSNPEKIIAHLEREAEKVERQKSEFEVKKYLQREFACQGVEDTPDGLQVGRLYQGLVDKSVKRDVAAKLDKMKQKYPETVEETRAELVAWQKLLEKAASKKAKDEVAEARKQIDASLGFIEGFAAGYLDPDPDKPLGCKVKEDVDTELAEPYLKRIKSNPVAAKKAVDSITAALNVVRVKEEHIEAQFASVKLVEEGFLEFDLDRNQDHFVAVQDKNPEVSNHLWGQVQKDPEASSATLNSLFSSMKTATQAAIKKAAAKVDKLEAMLSKAFESIAQTVKQAEKFVKPHRLPEFKKMFTGLSVEVSNILQRSGKTNNKDSDQR
ncbi:hypothetical protein [Cohaesibacter marisflavi]|uniref:hypothetical protein n=1 Tax=Cohaesibacter marisflavi TaxID=655353 RepID=UPI0029C7E78F|nr:hypothetical protein [Cohaesibacter marisflavi]